MGPLGLIRSAQGFALDLRSILLRSRGSLRRTQGFSSQHPSAVAEWARWDSNPDSKDYESSALTVKLQARLLPGDSPERRG